MKEKFLMLRAKNAIRNHAREEKRKKDQGERRKEEKAEDEHVLLN